METTHNIRAGYSKVQTWQEDNKITTTKQTVIAMSIEIIQSDVNLIE